MVEFLYEPFLPGNLRPKYLKSGGIYPLFTTCSTRLEGGPLGQAAKPHPKRCGPLPLPRGQAILHFRAVVGAMLSLAAQNHISDWFSTNAWWVGGGWGVRVTLCPEKKRRNGKTLQKPSWTQLLQGPFLQTS